MNLKKFKKSLVSIVLGSSLFLGNGGVICQQPKAWLSDKFFTNAKERYKADQNIQLLLMVSEFLSDLRCRPSTLNTKTLQRTKKLFDETFGLTLNKVDIDYLKPVLQYLAKLEALPNRSEKLDELQKNLMVITESVPHDDIHHSENTENKPNKRAQYNSLQVTALLLVSALHVNPKTLHEHTLMQCLEILCRANKQITNSAGPAWMLTVMTALLTN